MSAKLLHQHYSHNGHNEAMLTAIPAEKQYHILLIPPLFAEMNKMRHTLVQTMRRLANKNIASTLPDLPGCNESLQKLSDQSMSSWRTALEIIVEHHNITHIVAVRGGCLIDDIAANKPHFRLNSVNGANIIKTMMRSKLIAIKESGREENLDNLARLASQSGTELAGYELSAALYNDLKDAIPSDIENLTENKIGEQVEGKSLWMRAEPEYDEKMMQSLADVLAIWCRS